MRHVVRLFMLAIMAIILAQPAMAQQDRPFAIRFGLVGMEPTSSGNIGSGANAELDTAFGLEFDFEWYFGPRVGLEASIATLTDVDVDSNDDMTTISGINVTPLTIGINGHFVRSESIDWYVGVLAGAVRYGDFDIETEDGSTTGSTNKIDTAAALGIQTAADFNIGPRWAVNIGIKYLVAELEPEETGLGKVDIDPIFIRAMGVFRF